MTMMFNAPPELQAYRAALEELFYVNNAFAALAQGMGEPVWSRSAPTAQVEYVQSEGKIRFVFNPDWILTLEMEEAAGIIAHEAHHVVLEHLKEVASGEYTNPKALIIAHECICNDTIATVFRLPLPGTHYRGPDVVGVDTTPLSTRQVYDLIMQPQDKDGGESEDEDKNEDEKPDKSSEGKAEGKTEENEQSSSPNSAPEDADPEGSDCDEGGEPGEGDEGKSGEDDPSDTAEGESSEGDQPGKGKPGDAEGEGSGEGEASDGDSKDGEGKDGEGPSAKDTEDRDDLIGNGESGEAKDPAPGDDDDSNADGKDGPQSCGGVVVPEGTSAKDVASAIAAVVKAAAAAEGITAGELVKALVKDSEGGFSITGLDLAQQAQMSVERMNWRKLLAKINPKVLESGKPRRKTRNNWTSYNRRMGSVYPRVILPKVETVAPRRADDKGETLPVVVIALDLSGSIPRELVKTLQGLLNEIPEKLIKAYPCTWASYCYPYEEGTRNVASGGTEINSVVRYVEKIKTETGADPYVLVISDGQFPRDHRRPGKDWYFMAVNKASVKTMTQGMSGAYYRNMGRQVKPGEECYLVDDFKI